MASFPEQQTTTSNSTDAAAESDSGDSTDETDDGPGLLGRFANYARTVADVLSPFTQLLTALVQAATVYTFVRGDPL